MGRESNTETTIRPIIKTVESNWLEQCFAMLKERKPFILKICLPDELKDEAKLEVKRKVNTFIWEQAVNVYSGWDQMLSKDGYMKITFYTQ